MSTYYDLYETPDVQNTGEKQPCANSIMCAKLTD